MGEGRIMDKSFRKDLQVLCDQNFDQASKTASKKHTKKGVKDPSKKQSKMRESGKMKVSRVGMVVSSNIDSLMGPLQEAAAQVDVGDINVSSVKYLQQDPFQRYRISSERKKKMLESQIPLLAPQSIEIDCPDGFNVDQYAWSKLQELRYARIQKEIDEKLMMLRLSDIKQRIEEVQSIEKGFD